MKKFVFLLFPIVFCLTSIVWLFRALLLGYYPDFSTQYYSAKYAFSGVNPYVPNVGLYTPQVYPPSEFFFFLPFTIFPIDISANVYTCFSLGALIVSLVLLSKTFEIKPLSNTGLLLVGLAFSMFPVKFTLGMGQVNIFILLLLTLGLYFMKRKKDFLSGSMVGMAFIIKLFPVFIPIFFLTHFKMRILYGFLVVLLFGIIAPLIFFKQEIYLTFVTSFIELANSWKLDYYNQSLSGFLGRSFGTGGVGSMLRFSMSGITSVGVFIFLLKHRNYNFTDLSFIFGILIAMNLILNTFSWQHHFVLLIIPFYITFWYLRKIKARWFLYYLLALSYFLVSVNFPNPLDYHLLYRSHVFYGACLMLGLMIYLLNLHRSSKT